MEQLERVSHYPEMVEAEVSRYEEIVCKYFNVKKQVKKEEPSAKKEEVCIFLLMRAEFFALFASIMYLNTLLLVLPALT